MKIALSYRVDLYPIEEGGSPKQRGRLPHVPIETYARSVHRELQALGHTVDNVYGKEFTNQSYYDLYMELDNGRDPKGLLHFGKQTNLTIPSAVWFVDSHGQPSVHKLLAPHYDHVFFAVWDKRDLFTGHPSAHWCPNATDTEFFFPKVMGEPEFDFGFFGSRHGLDRADEMKRICEKHGFTYDIRQIGGGPYKHKWPRTSDAMNNCKVLFNRGQKHDGPNLRVLESMAVGRPLITEVDERDGMAKLFVEGEHFLGYEAYTWKGLEEKMLYAKAHPGWCLEMANKARNLVVAKHLIKHRVAQMLEVFNG